MGRWQLHLSPLAVSAVLARGDGSFRKWLAQLVKAELIILDDWGLEGLTPGQCTDLLEVMDDRHRCLSTLLSRRPIF